MTNPYLQNACKHCGELFTPRSNAHRYCETCIAPGDLRGRQLMSYYKITRARYDEIFKNQEGLCAICRVWEARAVDHDHACCPSVPTCGECVRGLLCVGCNLNLAKAEESGVMPPNAALYLSMYAQ